MLHLYYSISNTHGRKLRFPPSKQAQFVTECGIDLEILMPPPQDTAPAYDQVIEKILREASAPMSVSELAQKISAERPSTAKDPLKAEPKYRPKIWRMIEIQGKDTLSDFNKILVHVFEHDFDHLGGFWKLVPRAARQGAKRGVARYREVDLGKVDPFGEGDAADVTIAELELAVGSRMKYVFDFGDWIEHVLTLEAIEPPQPNAEYPRQAKRNTPKYANCVEWSEKGKRNDCNLRVPHLHEESRRRNAFV